MNVVSFILRNVVGSGRIVLQGNRLRLPALRSGKCSVMGLDLALAASVGTQTL
jgi:hypothetical protein